MGSLDFGPFLALGPDARARLAAAATRVDAAAGAAVLRQDQPADAAFVLVTGLLRVEADGTVLDLVSAPALIGEMAILEGGVRTASVVAESDARLLRIDGAPLRDAVAADEAFAAALRDRVRELGAHTFLRRDSPFGDLPGDVLRELATKLRPMRFAPGEALFREGDRDDDIFLIRRGSVRVVRGADGAERTLATLGSGAFVGETAALTGAARSATVVASNEVDAYRLAGVDVRPLLQRYAALVDHFGDALNVRHRPRRAPGVSSAPSPDEPGAMILRSDTNGRYLKVSREAFDVLEDLDGERTLRDLVLRHFERTGEMDPPGVFRIVATLQAAGFASAPRVVGDETNDGLRTKLLDLLLAPRLETKDADPFARGVYHVLWPFTTRPAILLACVLGIVGGAVFALHVRTLSLDTFGLGGVVVAWLGLLLAGIGHELAHLLACKSFGSRLGRGGVGLMWFSPLIYVDTTDTWTLPRRQRILVNAAGPLFNFAFAGLLALLAAMSTGTAADLALWLAGMNYLAVLFNLSPLLEFDGYYVLTDLSNTPMLRRKALHFVFRDLLDRPRLPRGGFEWGLAAFALAFVLYGLVLTAFVMVTVPPGIAVALRQWLAPALVTPVWLLAALGILALTAAPLVDNVLSARSADVSETAAAGSAPS